MSYVDSPDLKVLKEKDKSNQPTITRILKGIKITSKEKVLIEFTKRVTMPATGEEDSIDHDIVIKVKSPHRPHKDLESAIKKLKKHALALFELQVENDKDFSITGMKVSGDIDMQTARVELILGKTIQRTDKIVGIPVGQISLYANDEDEGGSEYEGIDDLVKCVEKLNEEVFLYIDGKFADEIQLPLFG